ncbi:hypothetical protein RV134_260442 [Roseovarius sp. EC-HK134]|nr:hypothetical protein RV134_260442 [Roseovarius sp. EC-HK134]VVT11777.1 hypothetical protein RV420_290657 [Roseovarius sp. EC-SD190]
MRSTLASGKLFITSMQSPAIIVLRGSAGAPLALVIVVIFCLCPGASALWSLETKMSQTRFAVKFFFESEG